MALGMPLNRDAAGQTPHPPGRVRGSSLPAQVTCEEVWLYHAASDVMKLGLLIRYTRAQCWPSILRKSGEWSTPGSVSHRHTGCDGCTAMAIPGVHERHMHQGEKVWEGPGSGDGDLHDLRSCIDPA